MPILNRVQLNERELERYAAGLAQALAAGDYLALEGTLGTGKTTFARALIRALTGPAEEVPSPTFTLVQEYATPDFRILHYDLYRLEDPAELSELGLDDPLARALSIIEWPEIAAPMLPAATLRLQLAAADDPAERILTLEGEDRWRSRLQIT